MATIKKTNSNTQKYGASRTNANTNLKDMPLAKTTLDDLLVELRAMRKIQDDIVKNSKQNTSTPENKSANTTKTETYQNARATAELKRKETEAEIAEVNLQIKRLRLLGLQKVQNTSSTSTDKDWWKETKVGRPIADAQKERGGAGWATGVSMLTGGIVNPVIAQAIGLDKMLAGGFTRIKTAFGAKRRERQENKANTTGKTTTKEKTATHKVLPRTNTVKKESLLNNIFKPKLNTKADKASGKTSSATSRSALSDIAKNVESINAKIGKTKNNKNVPVEKKSGIGRLFQGLLSAMGFVLNTIKGAVTSVFSNGISIFKTLLGGLLGGFFVKAFSKLGTIFKPGAKTAKTTIGRPANSQNLAKNTAAKVSGKSISKGVGKSALKKIPGLGALAGLAFGAQRAMSGDWKGAGLEVLSGAASTMPGLGTAASIGIDSALAYRDHKRAQNPHETPESSNKWANVLKVAGKGVAFGKSTLLGGAMIVGGALKNLHSNLSNADSTSELITEVKLTEESIRAIRGESNFTEQIQGLQSTIVETNTINNNQTTPIQVNVQTPLPNNGVYPTGDMAKTQTF